ESGRCNGANAVGVPRNVEPSRFAKPRSSFETASLPSPTTLLEWGSKTMVGWLGRRTEPRVGFRREVRVSWPGQVSGVVARAVNLSPTGILVDAPTPQPCPVGSPILCDVPLLHGSLRLRGRVAHKRVLSPAKVGMGIAFTDLSPWMAAELRDVVDESAEKAQVVKLRFAGKSQL